MSLRIERDPHGEKPQSEPPPTPPGKLWAEPESETKTEKEGSMLLSEPRTVQMVATRSQLAPDGRTMLRRGSEFLASPREAEHLVRVGLATPKAGEAKAAVTEKPSRATAGPAEKPAAGPAEDKERVRQKPGPKPKAKAD